MAYLNYFNKSYEREEKRSLIIGLIFALIFHFFLLLLKIPEEKRKIPKILPEIKVIHPIRKTIIREKEEIKREVTGNKKPGISIPVPVQFENFIKPFEDFKIPDLIVENNFFVNYIPEIPAPPEDNEPLFVGGDVQPPVRLTPLNPTYTEQARKAKIEGKVILQLIIDRNGNVINVKVLKALPFGLTEEAVEEAKRQKFKPAYRLSTGQPVDCFWTITIFFKLN